MEELSGVTNAARNKLCGEGTRFQISLQEAALSGFVKGPELTRATTAVKSAVGIARVPHVFEPALRLRAQNQHKDADSTPRETTSTNSCA